MDLKLPKHSATQVLEKYTQYADGIVGKFGIKPDGHQEPSVRTLFKPLLGLFYAAAGKDRDCGHMFLCHNPFLLPSYALQVPRNGSKQLTLCSSW